MSRSALLAIAAGSVLTLALAGVGAYGAYALSESLEDARTALREARTAAEEAEARLALRLAEKTEEAISLEGALRLAQEENVRLSGDLEELNGTVNDLEKIVAAEPVLLAKYSKVYFLNENYVPSELEDVAPAFAYQPERSYKVHGDVEPFLEDLLEDAREDGFELKVASSYRSFAEQKALKSSYTVRFGTGANAFSAEQGYSEHQLGTAVDFTTDAVGGMFVGFDRTEEFAWLTENAWRYGFILSYPKGNSYYQYEPWHWRFVGRELAERLHEDEKSFYTLDQRTIDEYLGKLFD
ncbi:MAG: M15 family metallopeptidase [Patescibacteria group bacterium]